MLTHQRDFLLFTTVENQVHSSDVSADHRIYDLVINDWACDDTAKFSRATPRPKEFRPTGDITFDYKLHKWPTIVEVLKQINYERYKAVCFMDDDVVIEVEEINNLFLFGQKRELELYQPALTKESGDWHKILFQQDGEMHPTYFIETMCPFFNGSFLQKVYPFMELYCQKYQGGWGLDKLWSDFARKAGDRLAVVDKHPMYHPGGPVSELWKLSSGITPGGEYGKIIADPDLLGWIESATSVV